MRFELDFRDGADTAARRRCSCTRPAARSDPAGPVYVGMAGAGGRERLHRLQRGAQPPSFPSAGEAGSHRHGRFVSHAADSGIINCTSPGCLLFRLASRGPVPRAGAGDAPSGSGFPPPDGLRGSDLISAACIRFT